MLEAQPVDELLVAIVEAEICLQLLAYKDSKQVVDPLPLQELDRLQLQQVVQQERVGVCNTQAVDKILKGDQMLDTIFNIFKIYRLGYEVDHEKIQ